MTALAPPFSNRTPKVARFFSRPRLRISEYHPYLKVLNCVAPNGLMPDAQIQSATFVLLVQIFIDFSILCSKSIRCVYKFLFLFYSCTSSAGHRRYSFHRMVFVGGVAFETEFQQPREILSSALLDCKIITFSSDLQLHARSCRFTSFFFSLL